MESSQQIFKKVRSRCIEIFDGLPWSANFENPNHPIVTKQPNSLSISHFLNTESGSYCIWKRNTNIWGNYYCGFLPPQINLQGSYSERNNNSAWGFDQNDHIILSSIAGVIEFYKLLTNR
jgi:hypothetical protein